MRRPVERVAPERTVDEPAVLRGLRMRKIKARSGVIKRDKRRTLKRRKPSRAIWAAFRCEAPCICTSDVEMYTCKTRKSAFSHVFPTNLNQLSRRLALIDTRERLSETTEVDERYVVNF